MPYERSMESLHNKLKIVYSYVNGLSTYNPVNPLITVNNIKQVCDRITEINALLITPEQNLSAKRVLLYNLVNATEKKNGYEGLKALMRDSTSFVEAMGSDHKSDAKMLRRIVNHLHPVSKGKSKENGENPAEPDPKKKRSTSETGIGSVIKQTEDFIKILENNAFYSPSDTTIGTSNFQSLLSQIKNCSNDIQNLLKVITPLKSERNKLINDKVEGIRKIISQVRKYIKSNYGENSAEWNGIRNIEVK